jgi:hypothetical protein
MQHTHHGEARCQRNRPAGHARSRGYDHNRRGHGSLIDRLHVGLVRAEHLDESLRARVIQDKLVTVSERSRAHVAVGWRASG